MAKSLDDIGVLYKTDKSSIHHNFLGFYEEKLRGIDIKTVVEVGIYNGASLRMWGEYFPDAQIIGLDNDINTLINEGNIKSFVCDQIDREGIKNILKDFEVDLFIDDGSHFWPHQVITYNIVWPLLKVGGAYIVEDLHTSNYQHCAMGMKVKPLHFFEMLEFDILRQGSDSITSWKVKE